MLLLLLLLLLLLQLCLHLVLQQRLGGQHAACGTREGREGEAHVSEFIGEAAAVHAQHVPHIVSHAQPSRSLSVSSSLRTLSLAPGPTGMPVIEAAAPRPTAPTVGAAAAWAVLCSCGGVQLRSGLTPIWSISLPAGVLYFATVTNNAEPSASSNTDCFQCVLVWSGDGGGDSGTMGETTEWGGPDPEFVRQ